MAQSFGTLEFAGESDHVFDRDKDNRRFFARRSYNLYSDVQRGENVVVEIPVQAGEKHFKYEQKVKLINPKLYGLSLIHIFVSVFIITQDKDKCKGKIIISYKKI